MSALQTWIVACAHPSIPILSTSLHRWGYTGNNYGDFLSNRASFHFVYFPLPRGFSAYNTGSQMAGVRQMMDRVAGLTSQCDKMHSTVELHVCILLGYLYKVLL